MSRQQTARFSDRVSPCVAPVFNRCSCASRAVRLTACLCAACCGSLAFGREPAVTVKTVTDDALAGRLIEFSTERGLVLDSDETGEARRVAAEDIVHIVVNNKTVPVPRDDVQVELAGGDRVRGQVTGFDDDVVTLASDTLGELGVPLERIRLWKGPAASDPRHGRSLGDLLGRTRSEGAEDALLLTNGDVLRGFVASIDRGGFVLDTTSGEVQVDHASVVAAALVPVGADGDGSDAGLKVRIHLVDGQRLTASDLTWTEVTVAATVFGRGEFRLPADRIARLDIVGGRWEWLTELEPISYEHTSALGLPWDWSVDRNVQGGPIRVAGQVYEHGLGMHSEASITFDLKSEYSGLVTSMGLDDSSGPYANVDVEIRVDGQLRFARDGITPGELHGPVRLDVTGARRVKLSVLFGRNADVQDRFNWVGAALIR